MPFSYTEGDRYADRQWFSDYDGAPYTIDAEQIWQYKHGNNLKGEGP